MRACIPAVLIIGLVAVSGGSAAAETGEAPEAPPAPKAPPGVVEQYCSNIRDAAADARAAWQAEMLRELEQQIEERIAELDAKRAEYEQWLERREAFIKKAGEQVVAIYAKMRPDAAAQQLAALDQETAASVLANLVPRTASAILNEMEPRTAAQLAVAMTGPAEEAQNRGAE